MTTNKQEIPINPTLLVWARTESGFSLSEVACHLKITTDKLSNLESGATPITASLLEKISKLYKRPIITFFLPSPPIKEETFIDYRTYSHSPKSNDTPEFSAIKRRVINIHETLLDMAKKEDWKEIPFISSLDNNQLNTAIKNGKRFFKF